MIPHERFIAYTYDIRFFYPPPTEYQVSYIVYTGNTAVVYMFQSDLGRTYRGITTSSFRIAAVPRYAHVQYLRGTIVNRTYGIHKNLYISLYSLTMLGPIYYGPP